MIRKSEYHKSAQGFTLIEILVAIIVIGAGLLVTARLQLMAIQNTQGGYMRSQASNLGYDMIDRMRTNIPGVTAGDYDIGAGDATPGVILCKGAAANCTTAQMAQFDQYWWRETINEFLPSGTGAIETEDNGTFTTITISLSWVDPNSVENGVETNVFTAELPR